MDWSLILIATMDLIGFTAIMVMLSAGFRILREIHEEVAASHVRLEDMHALTAKTAAALDNVSRLVIYGGGRAPKSES